MGGRITARCLASLRAEGFCHGLLAVEIELGDAVIWRLGCFPQKCVGGVFPQARQIARKLDMFVEEPVPELLEGHILLALHQRHHLDHYWSFPVDFGPPRSASSPRRIFSGVIGMVVTRTPQASKMAFAMAGIGELAVISPMPLAP